MNMELYRQAADYIKERTGGADVAIVLGSGLGSFAKKLTNAVKILYSEIPHFPKSTALSHEGALYSGNIGRKKVICMSGRFHYYEGYSIEEVVFFVRVLKLTGVNKIILTNAAGGVNKSFVPGDLMIVNDHINFTGISPLRGENEDEFGVRFPDMTYAYSPDMRSIAKSVAEKNNIDIKEGVYAYMTGPSYETPAEIRALSVMGADAVGMSTVPECVSAVHCGMDVLAISCITNMAAGITGEKLTGEEVITAAGSAYNKFSLLIESVIKELYE